MATNGAPIIIRRKKIVAGHGHHGGAWKVAYADFVTAMMAFFLVMWLMGSDEETKAAIAHYFNHPNTPYVSGKDPNSESVHPLGERNGEGDSILSGMEGLIPDDLVPPPIQPVGVIEQNKELAAAIREIFGERVFEMELELEYVKFSVPEELLFKPHSSTLNSRADEYLDRIGALIQRQKWFLTIGAYTTDTQLDGSQVKSLYESSIQKSVSILNYFVAQDWVPEENMQPLGIRGPSPAEGANPMENEKMNHRVEFILKRYQGL